MPDMTKTRTEIAEIYKDLGWADLYTLDEFIERMVEKGWVVIDD